MSTLAIDFDGTIASNGVPKPAAVAAIKALHTAGCRLILWSCRCNPCDDSPQLLDEEQRFWSYGAVPARVETQWAWFNEMRTALKAAQLWSLFDVVWQAPGKPVADVYVDNLAEPPDWQALVTTITGGTLNGL